MKRHKALRRRRGALFRCQFLLNGGDDARIAWLDRRREARLQVAIAADEIFVEIPAWRLQRPLGRRPSVEGMRVLAFHRHLFGDRERDVEFALRGRVDVCLLYTSPSPRDS